MTKKKLSAREDFGKLLRTARERKGLSQKQVSEKMGWSSSQLVSNFERGVATPPVRTAQELGHTLSIRPKMIREMFMRCYAEKLDATLKGGQ